MKLIPNFAELLHEIKLPEAEKCFFIEKGNEKYIDNWIKNGELRCELRELIDWINVKFKLKKKKSKPRGKTNCQRSKEDISCRKMACHKNF